MPDDSMQEESRSAGPGLTTPSAKPGLLRRHWGKITLAAILLIPMAVYAIWAAVTLGYSYSSGERVGYVQKLSHKGWVCKTWEGELQMVSVPGSAPIQFAFTVRSDSLANLIQATEGKQVALKYEQHRGVPSSCFGETEYFVVDVRVLGPR